MNTRLIVSFAVVALFLTATPSISHTPEERQADLSRELSKHFDEKWIADIFNHQNMCAGREIPTERLKGGWSELEARVMSEPSLVRGEHFFRSHESLLDEASKRFRGGDLLPFVVTAILRIESDFGDNRTGVPVIRTLFAKYHRITDGPSGNAARTKVLREEILPFFRAAEANGWDVCEIRGSRAAAFGYPHFIPASLRLAVDGDGDGKVDIVWNLADSAHSIAHYLSETGWHSSQSRAIFRYNPDNRYVRIVLRYAKETQERVSAPSPVTASR